MNRVSYTKAGTYQDAHTLATGGRYSLPIYKAGGMDVLDHMKSGLIDPDLLIDIRSAAGGKPVRQLAMNRARIRIDAGATLADIAGSDLIRKNAPMLAQAAESAATPQVRNVASAAGNLLQRPRCWYYRNEEFDCLKKGGHKCFAVEGENQYHAIFGDGPCHIVHPSNLAPALMTLVGTVELFGGDRKELAIADLFHLPDSGIRSEHNLKPGELITAITCAMNTACGFYAVKEKQSFDWPLVFCCVSLRMDGAVIQSANVCAGAVAPIPWRLPKVEAALVGVDPKDDAALRKACAEATAGAKPMSGNAYKTQLLPVAVRRAVLRAMGMPFEEGTP